MPLSRDDIEAARTRHPIVDVLARFGIDPPARWNGTSDFMISCPIPAHPDTTPSCIVHPVAGRFFCFGCGGRGDVFQLVNELTPNRDIAEAIAFLDGDTRHLLPIPSRPIPPVPVASPDRPDPARTPVARILEINGVAWQVLTAPTAASTAQRYLSNRGIDITALDDIAAHPLAGYTPASRTGLTGSLHHAGFTPEEILDAGWAVQRDDELVDRFRRRVVLPIRDIHDGVVGVIARDITGMARQKYLNTSETAAFQKGAQLYRPVISQLALNATVIVSEGPLDALAIAVQAAATGWSRSLISVAPCGTALTAKQVELIRRIGADQLVLCPDGDRAGRTAGERWAELTAAAGLCPRVVRLATDQDPASLVAQGLRWDAQAIERRIPAGMEAGTPTL
jgi:DNA primase